MCEKKGKREKTCGGKRARKSDERDLVEERKMVREGVGRKDIGNN